MVLTGRRQGRAVGARRRRWRAPVAAVVPLGAAAVVVSACLPLAYAYDTFSRTVTNGWGAAVIGGPWTQVKGSPGDVSADGSAGVFAIPAGNYLQAEQIMTLSATSQRDYTGSFVVSFMENLNTQNPRYGGLVAYLVARYQNSSATGYYRMGVAWDAGTRHVWLRTQNAAGHGAADDFTVEKDTGIDPVKDDPGGGPYAYHVMVKIAGAFPTTFSSKVWKVGSPEPTSWMLTGTDKGNLGPQVPGPIGVRASDDLQSSASTYLSFTAHIHVTDVNVGP